MPDLKSILFTALTPTCIARKGNWNMKVRNCVVATVIAVFLGSSGPILTADSSPENVSPTVDALQDSTGDPEAGRQSEGSAMEEKQLQAFCSALHQVCIGTFDQLILRIVTDTRIMPDGTDLIGVHLQLEPGVVDWVQTNVGCSLNSWNGIKLNPESSPMDQNMLDQVYIALALGRNLQLRFETAADQSCYLPFLIAFEST